MTEYSVMTPKQHFCLPTTPPLVTFNRQLSEDHMLFFSNIVITESAVLLIYGKRKKSSYFSRAGQLERILAPQVPSEKHKHLL
jgi:hypothetical protein